MARPVMTTRAMDRDRQDLEGFLATLPSSVRRQRKEGLVGRQKRTLAGPLLPMTTAGGLGHGRGWEDGVGPSAPQLDALSLGPQGKVDFAPKPVYNSRAAGRGQKGPPPPAPSQPGPEPTDA
jgi:hypothetical protein